jgi:predicted DNA-binding transcriptional regulator AlpA
MSCNEFVLPDPALVPDDQIAMTLTQLAALQSALAARLILARGKEDVALTIPQEEELLTAEQAAALLSVSVDWMYRHASGLPFTKRLSRKALRFSRAGLLKWRAGRRA